MGLEWLGQDCLWTWLEVFPGGDGGDGGAGDEKNLKWRPKKNRFESSSSAFIGPMLRRNQSKRLGCQLGRLGSFASGGQTRGPWSWFFFRSGFLIGNQGVMGHIRVDRHTLPHPSQHTKLIMTHVELSKLDDDDDDDIDLPSGVFAYVFQNRPRKTKKHVEKISLVSAL